jgi:hypothetical protein
MGEARKRHYVSQTEERKKLTTLSLPLSCDAMRCDLTVFTFAIVWFNVISKERNPEGEWWELFDEKNNLPYFYNIETAKTEWTRPTVGTVIKLSSFQVRGFHTKQVTWDTMLMLMLLLMLMLMFLDR